MKAPEIMKNICRRHGVTPNAVRGKIRSPALHAARIEFAVLCRMQGWSTTVIGRLMRRDHTTVLYYLKKQGEKP